MAKKSNDDRKPSANGNPAWKWDEGVLDVLRPMADAHGVTGLTPILTITNNPDAQVWVGEKDGRPFYVVYPRSFWGESLWKGLVRICFDEGLREWEKRG